MESKPRSVSKPEGKLAVLLPGLGAVSTTLIAGVELMRMGKGAPVGSLTQMGMARLGKRTEGRTVRIQDLVPLASVRDIVFGAWDIVGENAYQVAERSSVLHREHLALVEARAREAHAQEGRAQPRVRAPHRGQPLQGHGGRTARASRRCARTSATSSRSWAPGAR